MPQKSTLLIGEGDFSFAAALARRGLGHCVIATCLLNGKQLNDRQQKNIETIKSQGGHVYTDVDARSFHCHPALNQHVIQRIMFNFPHVGGKMKLGKNRELLRDFFVSSSQLIADGEVWVTLCRGQGGTPTDAVQREWHNTWQVVAMAAYGNFVLSHTVPFHAEMFPTYRSTGYRSQEKAFHTEGALTHVFIPRESIEIPRWEASAYVDNALLLDDKISIPPYFSKYFQRCLWNEIGHPIQQALSELLKAVSGTEPRPTIRQWNQDVVCVPAAKEHHNQEKGEGTWILFPGSLDHDNCRSFWEDLELESSNVWILRKKFTQCEISPWVHPVCNEVTYYIRDGNMESIVEVLASILNCSTSSFDVEETPDSNHLAANDKVWENHTRPSKVRHVATIMAKLMLFDNLFWCQQCQLQTKDSLPPLKPCSECCRHIPLASVSVLDTKAGKTVRRVSFCLDHICMVRNRIEDWRILWSNHSRWALDSARGKVFSTASLHPPSYTHDLSFWESTDFDEALLFSVVRNCTGDTLKRLRLLERYRHPCSGTISRCYRFVYQSCDRPLSQVQANAIQLGVRSKLQEINLEPR